jgi:forkhead box protein K
MSSTDSGQTLRQPADEGTISAYYSLVLPDFTYYVQTLAVTIGRRCTPAIPGAPSSSKDVTDPTQADVDLGPVKSVSRLHARIEYDEAEERFVLSVIGRNGAWVDGVWSGAGSRVPLGERLVELPDACHIC